MAGQNHVSDATGDQASAQPGIKVFRRPAILNDSVI